MKKNVFGRKLGRDREERKALFKSLMSSLIISERIQTTESKAKAIKSEIEKLVTKAKIDENSARRVLERTFPKHVVEKLIKDIAPRFSKRQGGYTRLIKVGARLGDNASMVIVEWVETSQIVPAEKPVQKDKKEKGKKKELKPVRKIIKKTSAKQNLKKPVKSK